MHILITGHTGFKGSWMTMVLSELGHRVSGISLPPTPGSLYLTAKVKDFLHKEEFIDIRDRVKLLSAINGISPDVIIHLAAQPLVSRAFLDPIETFEINLIGTLNILDSATKIESKPLVLIVTTDKVYKPMPDFIPHKEEDELGGDEPYGASKAAADIASQAWAIQHPGSTICIARAGNVIGGGDWSRDRLIPDLFRAHRAGEKLLLRSPSSIRPWQHVLDCLNGYILLINEMSNSRVSGPWNFGPMESQNRSVSDVVREVYRNFGVTPSLDIQNMGIYHETPILRIDSTKSRKELKWEEKLSFEDSIKWTFDWYSKGIDGQCMKDFSMNQVKSFLNINLNQN
jgi:CDP-glucose 4,6-dehydratase